MGHESANEEIKAERNREKGIQVIKSMYNIIY